MNAGLYSAVSGSIAAQTRLDVIANNLAYSTTSGFKGERFVQVAERVSATETSPVAVPTPITRGGLYTDFAQGKVLPTGSPLDVAITGDGFFVVLGESGERLTRRGGLAIDAEGFLVSQEGMRVQGEGGDLELPPGDLSIAANGAVSVNGVEVGKLRIGTVPDPARLGRDSGTLFNPGNQQITDVDPALVQITQGAIEGSNVSPVKALAEMIETVRGFEAYMRAAERLDEMTARAVTEVGRV